MFFKVKLKAYLLSPFWEKLIFAILARSTVCDYSVVNFEAQFHLDWAELAVVFIKQYQTALLLPM